MAVAGVVGKPIGGMQGLTEAVQGDRLSKNQPAGMPDFKDVLARASQPTAGAGAAQAGHAESLKFSAHAVDRMKSRGISFSPDMMKGIESAVSRAAQKGSKDTLVLTGDNALIVSVKNNTVVTVMDRQAMRENVFTNIDSTVVV
jgi:flagellar operon protein